MAHASAHGHGARAWLLCILTVNMVLSFNYDMYYTFNESVGQPAFWPVLFVILTVCIGKDIYSVAIDRHFNYKSHHIIEEHDAAQAFGKNKGVVALCLACMVKRRMRAAMRWESCVSPISKSSGTEVWPLRHGRPDDPGDCRDTEQLVHGWIAELLHGHRLHGGVGQLHPCQPLLYPQDALSGSASQQGPHRHRARRRFRRGVITIIPAFSIFYNMCTAATLLYKRK